MLDRLLALCDDLRRLVRGFDPDLIDGATARLLVERFAEIEKAAAAGKTLAARRVEDANAHVGAGARSAAEWLAHTTGVPLGEANAVLDTARRIEQLPATDDAFRAGKLSEAQARQVAAGATANPNAEDDLLRLASLGSMKQLQDRSRRIQNTARDIDDDEQRAARQQRERSLRTWIDSNGMGCGHWQLPPDAHGRLLRRLEQQRKRLARQASAADDSYANTMADALVASIDGSADGPPRVPSEGIGAGVLLVDLVALRRGHPEGDERCEIDGVGAIPVARARELLGDAALDIVLRTGQDINSVIHLGREFTREQRIALIARDPVCIRPTCGETQRLQFEHRDDWAKTLVTTVAAGARVCKGDHDLKTYEGHTYRGEPGNWEWLRADGTIERDRPPPLDDT